MAIKTMTICTPPALLLRFSEQQVFLHRKLDQALSAHGISFTEFTVLRQLHSALNKQMRRIDLAQRIGLSASGVTRLLNPMEKTGLVAKESSERDARVSLVQLTEAGERLLEESAVSFDHLADHSLQDFNEQERSEFARLIGKLR